MRLFYSFTNIEEIDSWQLKTTLIASPKIFRFEPLISIWSKMVRIRMTKQQTLFY